MANESRSGAAPSAPESLADIGEELRRLSDKWIGDTTPIKTECLGLIVSQIANRIAAAAKREIPQPAGNAAAIRTALKRLRDASLDFYNQILNSQYSGILDKYTCAKQGFPAVLDVRAAIPAANAALAAAPAVECPPSNVAALRDALTPWVSLAEWLIQNAGKEALGRGIAEIVPTLRKRIDESKSALATTEGGAA